MLTGVGAGVAAPRATALVNNPSNALRFTAVPTAGWASGIKWTAIFDVMHVCAHTSIIPGFNGISGV